MIKNFILSLGLGDLRNSLVNLQNRWAYLTRKSAMTFKARMAMYRMMEKMTGEPAALPVFNAVEELQSLEESKGKKTKLWYVYQDIIDEIRSSDAGFAEAIAKYVPEQDVMVLVASERGDIDEGFRSLIENNRKMQAMRKSFISAISYPGFLIVVILGFLSYFSLYIIPQFIENMPPDTVLSGMSALLAQISKYYFYWFPSLVVSLLSMIIFVIWAMPNFTNKYRKYLENIPPFNMYRIMTGGGFLFALNSLTKAGFQQLEALLMMVNLAKPYLKYRIEVIIEQLADGKNVGDALIDCQLDFPDKQMVKELAIQAKYNDSDDSLDILSKTLTDDGLETIQMQSAILNKIITLFVFGTLAILVLGMLQLQADVGGANTMNITSM